MIVRGGNATSLFRNPRRKERKEGRKVVSSTSQVRYGIEGRHGWISPPLSLFLRSSAATAVKLQLLLRGVDGGREGGGKEHLLIRQRGITLVILLCTSSTAWSEESCLLGGVKICDPISANPKDSPSLNTLPRCWFAHQVLLRDSYWQRKAWASSGWWSRPPRPRPPPRPRGRRPRPGRARAGARGRTGSRPSSFGEAGQGMLGVRRGRGG